jgi:NTP pyrophosphatase (non-canonical NTP hydrolase)
MTSIDYWEEILAERERQDEKWGEQNHLPDWWNCILVEEVGESCQAILKGNGKAYRKEMIQVAAVAIAALESYDRNVKGGKMTLKRVPVHTCTLDEDKCEICGYEWPKKVGEQMDLLTACQLAYRKHHLGDESIGWEELGNALLDALCNEMGVDEYILWANRVKRDMKQPLDELRKKMG